MAGEWQVYGESASYWDVGERCEPPESAEAKELAFSPVCRVKKHALGEKHLRRVLAVPAMEQRIAELEAALREIDRLERDCTYERCPDCDYPRKCTRETGCLVVQRGGGTLVQRAAAAAMGGAK